MKHLLGLNGVSASEIQEILDEAFRMKKEVLQGSKKIHVLVEKVLLLCSMKTVPVQGFPLSLPQSILEQQQQILLHQAVALQRVKH